jgi:hypothetical protein
MLLNGGGSQVEQSNKIQTDLFNKNNYVLIKNFISKETANLCYTYALTKRKVFSQLVQDKVIPQDNFLGRFGDTQIPESFSCYGDFLMDSLLNNSVEKIEKIADKKLNPTYSYFRIYETNDILKRHVDRASCEISATLCLGYDLSGSPKDYNWGMFVEGSGATGLQGKEVYMEPGDLILYRGCEVEHWRENFKGKELVQVFLHFSNKEGPFKELCKYDTRPFLGLPLFYKNIDVSKNINELEKNLRKK